MPRGTAKKKTEKPIEQTVWSAANKLRGKVEPAEYKHVVLSLIFLKYANDRFNEHRARMIEQGQQQFLEMMPFYEKNPSVHSVGKIFYELSVYSISISVSEQFGILKSQI